MFKPSLEPELKRLREINAALIDSFAKTTTLLDIRVEDGKNIFTFQRDGTTFTIETYHTMSDNVALWREKAELDTE